MPLRRALGPVYWILAGIVFLELALLLVGALLAGSPEETWPFLVGIPVSGLWLAASAFWGRDRQRQAQEAEEGLRAATFRKIRRWCWGTLFCVGAPASLLTAAAAFFMAFGGC